MKTYLPDAIRNVGLFGHQGTGKTSLAEALVYLSGATTRMGRVEDGNTVCDFEPEEIKKGLSAKTVHNHLLLLNLMLRRATIWRLIRSNPVDSIDRPRVSETEMNILSEAVAIPLRRRAATNGSRRGRRRRG